MLARYAATLFVGPEMGYEPKDALFCLMMKRRQDQKFGKFYRVYTSQGDTWRQH